MSSFTSSYALSFNSPQGRGGGEVVRRHPERVRCVPVEDPAELLDIDRRQDLEQLERLEHRNDARLL